ncbi:MAG TPA: hypothetical protein VF659_09145 [Pyrinomonadaceae bacterium]|jgi:hypothetical protein
MKRLVKKIVLACAVCAAALYALAAYRGASAGAAPVAAAPQAAGTPTNPAMTDPDQFVWRAFVQMIQPAPGMSPPAQGDSTPVIWETWATDEDTFPGNGNPNAPCFPNNPDPAHSCPAPPPSLRKRLHGIKQQQLITLTQSRNTRLSGAARAAAATGARGLLSRATVRQAREAANAITPASAPVSPLRSAPAPRANVRAAAAPTPGPTPFEEVTRNLASFNFIRENNLYTAAGLDQQFSNNFVVEFPRDAVETKAVWVPLTQIPGANPSHYHTTTVGGTRFALVAFHIMTKDTPNWVWATWEHEDNAGRCDYMGCHDDFGVTPADVAPNPQTGNPYTPGTLTPALQALMQNIGPEWQHYRLKGAQVEFADPTGQPLMLGNSVTEGPFIQTSSCITCHAMATTSPTLGMLPIFNTTITPPAPDKRASYYGVPGCTPGASGCAQGPPGAGFFPKPFDPLANPQGSTRQFMPVDFVWAIPFNAN